MSSSAVSSGMRRRTPTIAAAWDCISSRPGADGMPSQHGMKARDDSARPLRIASRIQGSSASLAAILPSASSAAGSFRQRSPSASAAWSRTRMAGSSASLIERRRGKQLLRWNMPLETIGGHAQGVLAQAGMRIALRSRSKSAHRHGPSPRATRARAASPGDCVLSLRTSIKSCVNAESSCLAWLALHPSLDEQPLGRAAPPAVGMAQQTDELRARRPCSSWDAARSAVAIALGRTRQIRPRSCQRRKSTAPRADSGTNWGCSTSSRYMSTT